MERKKQILDQRRLYTERMRLQKGVFSSLANAAGHIGELYADFVQSDEVRNSMRATADAIEFMTNGTKATLTFSQGRYKSVIRKLSEKHPDDCQIIADNEDGSICAHVPVAWIRISPPKQYTEEQRQQMGERMRQNRSENTATQG